MDVAERGRLIVVDDEPVILNLLSSIFEEDPWTVVACADGASALSAMEGGGVDVLLTDKNLPDISGLELIRHARRMQPDAQCIVLTGYASLDTVLAAMQLEAFDYIVKPPKDIFDIRRKVKQAFEKIALGRENQRLLITLRERNEELEAALEELREVQAELIQSEKLAGLGTLAAGIAHEISSPLFGVMGLAEAILDEQDRELVEGYAREIVDYSRQIKEIVLQLSGYSRSASSEYHTTVELSRVIEDATRLVVRSLGFDPAAVTLDFGGSPTDLSHDWGRAGGGDNRAGADLLVQARTSEVQQIFVNLVKNAIEASLERHGDTHAGRVLVTAGRSDKWVWAAVTDNGDGIREELQKAIFDPFFTTKPPGRGTGLGLNIVYRILTKYRGTIGVESRLGEGTTFTVRFPTESAGD
ncbi:MAG: hybrid sensor histidine kinase/response regulator [Deltaproteobacteria bacterium]|nr:hybrid sensor histidine kinase/response regulator [Deltaproteobacteria bacterium]